MNLTDLARNSNSEAEIVLRFNPENDGQVMIIFQAIMAYVNPIMANRKAYKKEQEKRIKKQRVMRKRQAEKRKKKK